jgi:hypothetical protein
MGALIVIAAGVVVSLTRNTDHRAATVTAKSALTTTATPGSTASSAASPTATPTIAPSTAPSSPAPSVLGLTKRRDPGTTHLPLTGPAPVAASLAVALVLLACGGWLVAAPGPTVARPNGDAPGREPIATDPATSAPWDGAIQRLRSRAVD